MRNKIISGVVSLFVLAVLVMAGPGSAYKINTSNMGVIKPGKDVQLHFNMNIEQEEYLDIDYFVLTISNGDYEKICNLYLDGTLSCDDIETKQLHLNSDYGYGYGYGYGYNGGVIVFNGVWHTPDEIGKGKYDLTVEPIFITN